MTKEKVIDAVNSLPNEFVLDDLMERLIFIEKVEMGLEQVKQNKLTSHERLKNLLRNGKTKLD